MIMHGDLNEGRSAYTEHLGNDESLCKIEKDRIVMPGVSSLLQAGCTTRDVMLRSFISKAEGTCRYLRERAGVKIPIGSKSVFQIHDREFEAVFGHISWTLDQRLRVLEFSCVRIEEIMNPHRFN